MTPRCLPLALLSWALCAGGAAAQSHETPPPPGPPRALQIDTPQEQRLDNGLRVIVARRAGVPIVSVRLLVRGGAELDPPGRAGLAALTAGLMTRGTRQRSAPALARDVEALGGSLDGSAGWDHARLGLTVTRPKLAPALALLAEVAQQPALAQDELDRLRDQVLDGLKIAQTRPGAVAGWAVQQAFYGSAGYGRPIDGTPASLARVTRVDVQRLHRQVWQPGRAVIVFAGDITLDDAVQLTRAHFGRWRALPAAAGAVAPPAIRGPLPAPAQPLVIDMPGAGQAGVAVAVPGVSEGAPERHAAAVANAVLGQGYSSRLNQEIRIKRGLSYGAGSALDVRAQGGALLVAVQTKNASAAEVVQLIGAELDRLAAEPVAASELAARKAALIGGFGRDAETSAGLAEQVAALALAGLPLSELAETIPRLQAVDASEVQAFARERFAAEKRRLVVAGEAAEFVPALKQADPRWRVLPASELQLDPPPQSR